MNNLELVLTGLGLNERMFNRDILEALAAARLDCDEAYWRGVEDERIRVALSPAKREVKCAREIMLTGRTEQSIAWARAYARSAMHIAEEAFRGARGAERAAIRQRLEAIRKRGK